jgi:hypothetical protein
LKKEIAFKEFPGLYTVWVKNHTVQKKLPGDLHSYLLSIHKKFLRSKETMQRDWYNTANPFLTVMIENSYNAGVVFQQNAKTASSVETSWGSWVEDIFTFYNPNIKYIGAAGMDYVYNNIAYDVKSGPQVMNKDQVAQATTKRHRVKEMSEDTAFKGIIGVNEFKVAVVYGNKNIANNFMSSAEEGLIIYGKDTWDALTGNDLDAFDLFINSIKFMVSNGAEWVKKDLESAIVVYNKIFYEGDQEKLTALKSQTVYIGLERLLPT